jgi:SanA protein
MKHRALKAGIAVSAATVLTGGLALIAVALISRRMKKEAARLIAVDPGSVPPREVALVPGARVLPDGRLSTMLEDRVRAACRLRADGKVKKLLLSGDDSKRSNREVAAMRQFAVELGASPEDLLGDFAGFRTLDSMCHARHSRGIRSMVIVTQRFHLPRALYLARKLGIDAVGYAADGRKYRRSAMIRATVREFFARTSAWLDMNVFRIKPEPTGILPGLSDCSRGHTK